MVIVLVYAIITVFYLIEENPSKGKVESKGGMYLALLTLLAIMSLVTLVGTLAIDHHNAQTALEKCKNGLATTRTEVLLPMWMRRRA